MKLFTSWENCDGVLNVEVFARADGERKTFALLACVLDNPEAMQVLLQAVRVVAEAGTNVGALHEPGSGSTRRAGLRSVPKGGAA